MEDHENKMQEQGGTAVATSPEQAQRQPVDAEREECEECTFIPAVDIIDGDSETRLLMDVPGVDKDGLDISIEQDILTIIAKPSKAEKPQGNLVYSEYRIGDYKRSFSLSEKVNKDGITAKVKDGVLEIKLPKMEPITKKIAVSAN